MAHSWHSELIQCLEIIPEVQNFNAIMADIYLHSATKPTLHRLATIDLNRPALIAALHQGYVCPTHVEGFNPAIYTQTGGERGESVTEFTLDPKQVVTPSELTDLAPQLNSMGHAEQSTVWEQSSVRTQSGFEEHPGIEGHVNLGRQPDLGQHD